MEILYVRMNKRTHQSHFCSLSLLIDAAHRCVSFVIWAAFVTWSVMSRLRMRDNNTALLEGLMLIEPHQHCHKSSTDTPRHSLIQHSHTTINIYCTGHGVFRSCWVNRIHEVNAHEHHHKVITSSDKLHMFFNLRVSEWRPCQWETRWN